MSKSLPFKPVVAEHDKPVVMIVGRTGVGKSSMINHLLRQEAAPVGHIGSCTATTSKYVLNNAVYLLDTRGLEEVGASVETRQGLTERMNADAPDVLLYLFDCSQRSGLDNEMQELDSVLADVFTQSRGDPVVHFVLNRADLLAPAGGEYLPNTWPDTSTAKGENIHERIRQIYDLSVRFCRNRVEGPDPTALEWYKGAAPWNIVGIRKRLIKLGKNWGGSGILRRLAVDREMIEFLHAAQCALVDDDIAGTDALDERAVKREWLHAFHCQFADAVAQKWGGTENLSASWMNGARKRLAKPPKLLEEPITGKAVLIELALFEPYIPLPGFGKKIRWDPERFYKRLQMDLTKYGFQLDDLAQINRCFKTHLKALSHKVDLRILVPVVVVGGLAAWWAAPFVGGVIGAMMGFQGVVAVNAGLAWLGLGALAVGGFGMFGGTLVVIGAGAVLAAGSSAALMTVYASGLSRKQAIIDCARTLTTLDCVVMPTNDSEVIRDFERHFCQTTAGLRREGAKKDAVKVFEETFKKIVETRLKKSDARFCRESRQ